MTGHSASYINPAVNAASLGFVAIHLGGSRVFQPWATNLDRDWDGIGIVTTRDDVCRIVKTQANRLCELLWIEKEEHTEWKVC